MKALLKIFGSLLIGACIGLVVLLIRSGRDKDDEGRDVRNTTSIENRNLHNISFIASIDFDINLNSGVTNTSLTGSSHRERWTSSLRITPWVAHSKFNKCDPTVSGMMVGINVSYLGLARLLRM